MLCCCEEKNGGKQAGKKEFIERKKNMQERKNGAEGECSKGIFCFPLQLFFLLSSSLAWIWEM
jgi:hypothetical protein